MINIDRGDDIPQKLKDMVNEMLNLLHLDLREKFADVFEKFLNEKPKIDWVLKKFLERFLNRLTTDNLIFVDKLIELHVQNEKKEPELYYFFKINITIRLGRNEAALNRPRELAEEGQKKFPESEILFIVEKSYIEIKKQNYHEALKIITDSLRDYPKDRELLLRELFILINNDVKADDKKAFDLVSRAIHKYGFKDDEEFLRWNAQILMELDRDKEALTAIEKAIEQFPTNEKLHDTKISILHKKHRVDDAIEAVSEAKKTVGDRSVLLNWEAILLEEKLEFQSALEVINKALANDPNNRDLIGTKIKIYFIKKDYDIAHKITEYNLERFKDDEWILAWEIRILFEKQEYEAALELVEKAISIYGSEKWFRQRRIDIVRHLEDYDSAKKYIAEYQRKFGNDFNYYYLSAKVQSREEQYNDANDNLEKAIEVTNNELDIAHAHNAIALNYIQLSNLVRAKRALDNAYNTLKSVENWTYFIANKTIVLLEQGEEDVAFNTIQEFYERIKKDDKYLCLTIKTLVETANTIFSIDQKRARRIYETIKIFLKRVDALTEELDDFEEIESVLTNNIIVCHELIDGEIISFGKVQHEQFFPKLLKKL